MKLRQKWNKFLGSSMEHCFIYYIRRMPLSSFKFSSIEVTSPVNTETDRHTVIFHLLQGFPISFWNKLVGGSHCPLIAPDAATTTNLRPKPSIFPIGCSHGRTLWHRKPYTISCLTATAGISAAPLALASISAHFLARATHMAPIMMATIP